MLSDYEKNFCDFESFRVKFTTEHIETKNSPDSKLRTDITGQ